MGSPIRRGRSAGCWRRSLFRVERREFALYLPPTKLRPVLRSARVWEQSGRWLAPHLAGVTVTEAVKDAYAALPLGAEPRPPRRARRGRLAGLRDGWPLTADRW